MSQETFGLVMVVDDDPDIRETLSLTLELHGYTVVSASDGAEALAWLRANSPRPALIFLDLMMPKMNGVEFRGEQLRDPTLRQIPVVVFTGAGARVERGALVGLETLTKPATLEKLIATVERFCGSGAGGEAG
ncbi:MAG: response regulator [Deltaproteobacteria bacterium]|nr:response regulator [Deltaproteobacteria bacterium]